MALEILLTDKYFHSSPDAGSPDCICSRCGEVIPKEHQPVIRAWPTEPDDYGYDDKVNGGTEFRYCRSCCEGMGMIFCDPWPEEDDSEPSPVRTCRVCGCTDEDCTQCIAKTGKPCHWVEDNLCSACVQPVLPAPSTEQYIPGH